MALPIEIKRAEIPVTVHARFIGLYVWSTYWRKWDKVIDIADNFYWIVQEVDLNTNPTGDIRKHCTPQNVLLFANQPFDIYGNVDR